MDSEAGNYRPKLSKWLTVLVVVLLGVAVALALAWVFLRWSIAESVYSAKAGLDWFGLTFYHEYTFIAAALFSLLLVNPQPGRSDLRRLGTVVYRLMRPYEAEGENRPGEKMNIWLWGLWQTVKWAIGFYTFASFGAFPFLGPIMNPITMMSMGLGSWADVPRIFILPLFP